MSEQGSSQSLLLHLPKSLRERAQEAAQQQGVSLNFFITSALQERIEKDQRRHADRTSAEDEDAAEPETGLNSEDKDR